MQQTHIPPESNEIVIDWAYRHVIRDGYVFAPITNPALVCDALVIKYPHDIRCSSPLVTGSKRTLDEQIRYINEHKLEKAMIIAEHLDFITQCPTLKYIKVAIPTDVGDGFDYSPLYEMPQIKFLSCPTQYGRLGEFRTSIDYSKIRGIESIGVGECGAENYRNLTTLKSLRINCSSDTNLANLFKSPILDTLTVTQCKIKSLEGIGQSKKMQCVYLYYNRSLRDISALSSVKNTLKALRIENCPKIEDFSVLGELENLEMLELLGSNTIPNLDFLEKLPHLKTFVFSVNVADGDLSPCMKLSCVSSKKNRKHYNIKDAQLPKGTVVLGNESIETWRRTYT